MCSMLHVPSFMQHAEEFKQKGVDHIVCVSVNDVFVMDAWGKSLGADDILMVVWC
jgi:peroxiredoxin